VQHGRAEQGHAQRSNRLLEQGLLALALGGLLLLVPVLFGPGGPIAPAASMLRLPGLLLAAVGGLLLVSHVIVRRRAIRAWAHTHFSNHMALMEWTPELLQALAPAQFETMCAALFQQGGKRLRSRIRADNGALDLRFKAREPRGPVSLVRCMYLPVGEVSVPQLLHFYAVLTAHTLKRGTFATNASFSAEALRFARENGIQTLDGADLLAMIGQHSPAEQQALMQQVLR
jgi:restriction system protein